MWYSFICAINKTKKVKKKKYSLLRVSDSVELAFYHRNGNMSGLGAQIVTRISIATFAPFWQAKRKISCLFRSDWIYSTCFCLSIIPNSCWKQAVPIFLTVMSFWWYSWTIYEFLRQATKNNSPYKNSKILRVSASGFPFSSLDFFPLA